MVLFKNILELVIKVYSKLQTTKSYKEKIINDRLRNERKWHHTKHQIKTTRGRKRVEDKNNNKEQGQQIEKRMSMLDIYSTV